MKRIAQLSDPSVYQGAVWPADAQQLLLRAALLDGPAAIEAWNAWQEAAQIDALDSASWKLMPLVYFNLKGSGLEDPLLLQARDIHRYHWGCNQKLFHQSAGFLAELEKAKVPAIVLKGVSLANLYYPDTGARAMADLDVLVPMAKFIPLAERLLADGWRETDGYRLNEFDVDVMPSFGFARSDGFSVDIHCHVLHADCSRGADKGFWKRARPWKLRQVETLTLAPEDHLLHVISHGVRWCDVPPFRWIADAWWVLARSRAGFDWEQFCKQARFHHVQTTMLHGLDLMNQITPLHLPAGLPAKLQTVSATSRVRFIAQTHPLPTAFVPRARQIWGLLGDQAPGYTIVGTDRREPRGRKWDLRILPSLLLFFIRVAIRDRRKILAGLLAALGREERAKAQPAPDH